MPDNPLGTVNAYALVGNEGIMLIDCGWNTPEAYAAVEAQLAPLGGIAAVRRIVVTHLHPDHFGLATRLAEESGASVAMHHLDADVVSARYEETQTLVAQMESWLGRHGVPDDELAVMSEASLQLLRRVGTRRPDVLLEGGERLEWGPHRLEVLWTPGHSAGLICLLDADRRLLFSNDHVLERISPHVGMHVQSLGNPLGEYLASLCRVRDLPVEWVLPGHGAPFASLARRVDAIVAHHRERLDEILALLDGAPRSAYEIGGRLIWRGAEDGWTRLAPFQRRMALTETIAHVEYLVRAGTVRRHDNGFIRYARVGT
jgi:glyoxylase-like metal-dependent hydrolase (beta-lactamase superfamily II)